MHCESFETRLNQLLDRRLPPQADERLRDHAQACEECRELLAAQELLFDGLELFDQPELSPGFSHRVVANACSQKTTGVGTRASRNAGGGPRRWLAYTLSGWVAVSAVAAATLVLGLYAVSRLPRGPATAVASKPGPQAPGTSAKPAPNHTGTLSVTGAPGKRPAPAEKLATDGPDSGGASPVTSGDDYRGLLETLSHNFPEMPRDGLESVEQIPGGLRPIATSFNTAFGLLRRTLPGGKEEPAVPRKPQAAFPRFESSESVG